MATLTIVSGSPGAGKSTLSARLSKDSSRGLWIPADSFYSFPAYPIDPTTPESHVQNEAIIRALGASASSFVQSGYDVVLDGIFGPWFLPILLSDVELQVSVNYVLLTVDAGVAVSRVREREGRGASARALATNRLFVELHEFNDHRLDTTRRTPDEVYSEVHARLLVGRFALRRGEPTAAAV